MVSEKNSVWVQKKSFSFKPVSSICCTTKENGYLKWWPLYKDKECYPIGSACNLAHHYRTVDLKQVSFLLPQLLHSCMICRWWFVSYGLRGLNEALIQRTCHHSCCLLHMNSSFCSFHMPSIGPYALWCWRQLECMSVHSISVSQAISCFHLKNFWIFIFQNEIMCYTRNFSEECLWTLHKGDKLRSPGINLV